jgi:cytochrome c oxidase subunit II
MSRPKIEVLLCAVAILIPGAFAKDRTPISIHAKRYAFVPAEITLHQGQAANLLLISDDVPHGLVVKELGIHADLVHGSPVKVTVTPLEIGDFPGTCSRYCGSGHRSMSLTVHVVP